MAGAGWRQFTRETLSADVVQRYLMDQVAMVFPSQSARDAAIPLANRADGMVTYCEDTDEWTYWEQGAYWKPLGPRWPIQGVSDPFPVDGPRNGELLASDKYECTFIRSYGGVWHQSTPVVTSSLGDYVTRLQSRGVTSVHAGFMVYQSATDRLFVSNGGALSGTAFGFVQVGGKSAAKTGTTLTSGTGWNWSGTAGVNFYTQSLGGGMAQVYVEAAKATSVHTVPTNGNIANTTLGNVATVMRPETAIPLVSGATGRVATGVLSTNGDITLAAVAPGGDITVGEVVSLGGTYRLNDNLA